MRSDNCKDVEVTLLLNGCKMKLCKAFEFG